MYFTVNTNYYTSWFLLQVFQRLYILRCKNIKREPVQ